MEELKLCIHGQLVDATSNETFDNINPATREATYVAGRDVAGTN